LIDIPGGDYIIEEDLKNYPPILSVTNLKELRGISNNRQKYYWQKNTSTKTRVYKLVRKAMPI